MIRHQMTNQEKQLMLLLQDEIRQTQNLHESLQLESETLVTRDTDALDKVTRAKLEQLRTLELLGKQRDTLLSTVDGDPLNESSQLSALWQQLLSLAAECQKINRINGGIIEVSFRQSQQALDILQGKSSKSELYDGSGQTTRSASSNQLAQV